MSFGNRLARVRSHGPYASALVFLLALFAFQVDTARAVPEGAWRVYLYGNEVRALTHAGEDVYLATSGGLVRYRPGEGFRQWNRAANGLLSDSLRTLATSAAGDIWCGTPKVGISVFDPTSETFRPFTSILEPIPGDRVHRVNFEARSGGERLHIGAEQGFAVFDNGDLRYVCLSGVDLCGLPSFDVRDLLSRGEEIWLATAAGISVQRADGEFESRSTGLEGQGTVRIVESDSLYALTSVSSFVFRGSAWAPLTSGLPSDFVPQDLRVIEGELWLAGNKGVFRRMEGAWARVGAAVFPATSLVRTDGGTIYAGAADNSERLDGLWQWNGTEWEQRRMDGPSRRSRYRSLSFAPDGALWLSHGASNTVPHVARFGEGAWTFFDGGSEGRLNAWTWRTLFLDGDLWLAHCCCNVEGGCVIERRKASNGRFETFPDFGNLWDLDRDNEGRLWAASWSEAADFAYGVGLLDRDSTWIRFRLENTPQIRSNQVRALRAEGNEIWIGYERDGVHRWRLGADGQPGTTDDSWTLYTTTTTPPLAGNSVRRIEVAPDGKLWIGTTSGLSIWNGSSFATIGAGFGRLPNGEVAAILPTSEGGGWVATKQSGVTRLLPRAQGGYTYETIAAPYLPNPQVDAMVLGLDRRTVWFATERGLAAFVPSAGSDGAASNPRAYPNPFVLGCSDGIRLAGVGGAVSGVVVDLSGKVLHRVQSSDLDEVVWDGTSDGERVSPGLYWIRVSTPRKVVSVGVAILDSDCVP